MSKRTQKIVIILLVLIVLAAIGRYVLFKKNFDARSEGLTRIGTWESQYKSTHPNATKEEMDNAFKANINGLKKRKEDYIKAHPGASDSDADKAFNDAWSGAHK